MPEANRFHDGDERRLDQAFDCYGHFYSFAFQGQMLRCRSLLEIVAAGGPELEGRRLAEGPVDVLAVMMNPGTSRPMERAYREAEVADAAEMAAARRLTRTVPDTTQYQLMRLALARGWRHIRVLNLSDLRNFAGDEAMKEIAELEASPEGQRHSIFSELRAEERAELIPDAAGIPIVLGWGKRPALKPLARRALAALEGRWTLGVRTTRRTPAKTPPAPELYEHPYQYDPELRAEWRRQMQAMLEQGPDHGPVQRVLL
ncbi:MAG TPA: hypothetical protein VEH84_05720 [Alphaproteobacteria bacterium]|nr:hypothetical protein [Alphaproteobacteria bacterium]